MTTVIVSLLLFVLLADLGILILWHSCVSPSSRLLGPMLVRGQQLGKRAVAITFDDGPAPPFTEQILAILRERHVPATFFVCGENAERFPEILQQIQAEGHTIGNHTYSHPYLVLLTRQQIAEEIDRTQQVIQEITGSRPTLFRPPYGVRWVGLYSVLRERGLRVIGWSVSGQDWEKRAEEIVEAIAENLAPGSIILLHDGRGPWVRLRRVVLYRIAAKVGLRRRTMPMPQPPPFDGAETVKALPAIVDRVREAGFEFVPLGEFLT